MTTTRRVGVVIVAAGAGTRAGTEELKQFQWVAGMPMLLHSVRAFQARDDVVMVVCVLPRAFVGDPPAWLFQSDLDRLLISVGGDERGESVQNGLEDLTLDADIVLVHDAARPLVGGGVIDRVVAQVKLGTGAVPALPVADTIKEADDSGRVVRTVPRDGLWRAQTPQGFPREMLEEAYRRARADRVVATDDAALCERYGFPVAVVRGSERGAKVTVEGDFALVEALLSLPD